MKFQISNFKFQIRCSGQAVVSSIIGTVCVVILLYAVWMWGFCRFYVAPDHMAIITAKSGKALPPGEILAERGQKGVWKDVLGEGRYFFNPIFYDREIKLVIKVDVGKVGVVTAKVGTDLPAGEILADKGQKGIQKAVLGPGKYRLNPYGYEVNIQDALQIPIGYVGVVTSLTGKEAQEGEFAKIGEKGVMEDVLQPGLYYINPRQYQVDIVEVGTNQISLLGNKEAFQEHRFREQDIVRTKKAEAFANQMVVQSDVLEAKIERTAQKQKMYKESLKAEIADMPKAAEEKAYGYPAAAPSMPSLVQFIEFPSKDGFEIRLDMTVEFEFLPENSALIFKNYGDLFQVVEKIILPQILSISRLKGSAYGAKDFIVGEGREKFQDELYAKLEETLKAKGIDVLSALIRHVIVPDDIRRPIQDASIAIERNLTNVEKQETAKKLAELNTELSLISQRREQVQQETQKLKAGIKAEAEKEVAEINATTIKMISEIEKQTAGVQADRIRKIARADSDVVRMTGVAEAEGFKAKVIAFGDPNAYSFYEFTDKLPEDMKLIIAHTGPGTMWTDLNKALAGELGGLKILQQESK